VAPPVARVGRETDEGKKRPLSQPGCADQRVQRAVVRIVEALCAPDAPAFSHGVRKGPSPQHARHARREQCRQLHSPWRVEAEGSGCCDTLDWGRLRALLQQPGKEGGRLRLLGKGLHAGGREAGALTRPEKGAPQGGVSSPRVSNLFLQQVLDAWCVKAGHPRRQGRCFLTRCAEDVLLGCAWEADARRVMEVLPQRFTRFTRAMPPEKPVLSVFTPPPGQEPAATGQGTVACLGCTPSWAKTRRGSGVRKRKTAGKRLRRCMQAIWPGWRDNRHAPWHEQSRT
jgi:RNA-directed DNA polymerase